MSQCTCTTDKEATCIVHPTTRSLKDYIAKLEDMLQDCVDELKSINENAVSDCALESINCVIEDLIMFREKK